MVTSTQEHGLVPGDLLELFDTGHINVICHCCNINNAFGAGIARQIKKRYPDAYKMDCVAAQSKQNQLGNISYAHIKGGFIFNIYTQNLYPRDVKRKTNYEALYTGLEKVADFFRLSSQFKPRIGFPHGMGCGLGGGNWQIVDAMIRVVFKGFDFFIVKL